MSEKKKLRRLPKRILSFVLTLAMMLTLMPMFSTTVYAEPEDLCNFTATPGSNGTITIDGESKTSETWLNTKDGNTFTVNGDTVTYNDYGGNTVTLKAVPNEGYVFDKWTSYSVTISNGDGVGDIVANFKIPEHTHIWNYSVNGATLVAKCTGEGDCTVTNGKTDGVSLTLTADSANYSDSEAYTGATLEGLVTFKAATELTEDPTISYYKVDAEGATTDGTVVDASTLRQTAGYYYAAVTVGTATAKAAFEVQAASPVHTHSFATAWSINATHHWHACTGENNTEACLDEAGAAKAAHVFNNGVCACGAKAAVQIPASELKNEIEGLALILGGDKDVMLNQFGFWLANGVRPTELKSAAATAFMYSNFLLNNVQRGGTGAELLRTILDNLCAHKETQINLLDAIKANDSELIAAYTDEFFEVLGDAAFEISTDEDKYNEGKDVIIKAESLEAFRQNAIARADASTLVSTHERYSGYMAKFCDLLNLDAHKKSVMMAAYGTWLEDEDADTILNLVVDESWLENWESTDEEADETLVMFAKTFFSFTAEASCLIGNVTKAVDGEGDKSIDALKPFIDEVFPTAYMVMDLFDAVEAEDWPNVLTLISDCLTNEKELLEKVFEKSVDYSADVQASYAALRNTTHVWTDATHQTSTGVCLICGYTCSHTGGTATCIAKAKCSVCQAEYGEYAAHNYAYSAEGNVLTAACQTDGCNDTHSLTLTATSPNYSGIDNLTEFNTATGKNIAESDVKFYKVETEGATTGGSLVEGTPTEAGYYYASITVAEVTAKKAFKIATVSYTVEFISKGDVVKAYNNVKSGSLITEPANPDVAGFAGWYKDVTCTIPWDFDVDTVKADTKIYAKYVLTVTVTLDVNGGTFADGTETELEVNINKKLDEKTLEEIADKATNGAMVFSGWFKDEYSAEAWDFNEDIVTKDITLYIGWGYPAGHEEVAELSVTKVKDYIYTGKKITPAVSVSFGGKVLVPGTDYTVSYKNNVKAYNTVSGNNLVINEDGSIDYSNVDTAKAPTIIIKGKRNYSNKTIALNFNIQPVSLGNNADTLGDNISADICDNYATNNKSVIKVNGTVSYKGKKLNARDYTLTLVPENAEDASGNPLPKTELVGQKIPKGANGTFKLTAVGNGNYDGGFVKIITVADGAKTLQKAKITLKKIEYSGHDLTVDEIVDAAKGKLTVKIAGKPLTYGKDYTVEFPGLDKAGSRTNGGIYPIVIKGMGEYVGSRMVNVTVNGISIKKAVVTLDVVNPVYSGHHIGTNIKSVSLNGVGLTAGIDYDAVVKNDVKAGKASVTITGKGIYSGTKKVSYKIQKVKLTNEMFENVTISDNAIYLGKYDYRGGVAITPNVSIIYNGVKLINPADYSISLKNNTKAAGTAKATIKGKGNYTGSVNAIFSIGEDKIDNSKVNVKKATISVANKIYTGREITISGNDITKAKITVKEGKRNVTKDLILGTDFEIVSYVKNVNVGKAQFIIRGIGNYDGYKLVTFKITKKDLKWWQKELQ